MKALTKLLAGGLGLTALAAAAPAAAQYYPPAPYPVPAPGYGYPGSGYGQQGVLGNILDQLLGGRSYGSNERYAVEQCVRAVEHRINTRGLDNERNRYGYNNYRAGGARVVSITDVNRRSNGSLRVYGFATTGHGNYGYGNPGYGYDRYGYGNYGYQQAADARFNCEIDRYGRIRDIDANRIRTTYPYRR